MEITETLYVNRRDDWRAWLVANYRTAKEIWLIYPRKATGRLRIPYNQAVEEALCFGWIDSTVRRLDDQRYCQMFVPRREDGRAAARGVEAGDVSGTPAVRHPSARLEVSYENCPQGTDLVQSIKCGARP